MASFQAHPLGCLLGLRNRQALYPDFFIVYCGGKRGYELGLDDYLGLNLIPFDDLALSTAKSVMVNN